MKKPNQIPALIVNESHLWHLKLQYPLDSQHEYISCGLLAAKEDVKHCLVNPT